MPKKEEVQANEAQEIKTEAASQETVQKEKKPRMTLEMVEKALLEEQNNSGKFPEFGVGDTVKVYVKIVEGDKQRLQPYEGVVIAFRHSGNRKSFIVRRISYGVAIERVFPLHSPYVQKVEIVRKGKVRRAKLYYMRGRFGRSAVVSEKV